MAVLYKNLCLHTPRTYTKLPLVFNIIFKRKISENLYMNCCFIVVCIFTTDSCKKLYGCSLYACNNKSVLHENYNTRSTQRPNTHKFVCSFNVKCHLQSSCNFFFFMYEPSVYEVHKVHEWMRAYAIQLLWKRLSVSFRRVFMFV